MPLKTQSTDLETNTFIQWCVYKFKSRQELVNVPLEEKKDKYYMIKVIEEEKEEEEEEKKEDKEEE